MISLTSFKRNTSSISNTVEGKSIKRQQIKPGKCLRQSLEKFPFLNQPKHPPKTKEHYITVPFGPVLFLNHLHPNQDKSMYSFVSPLYAAANRMWYVQEFLVRESKHMQSELISLDVLKKQSVLHWHKV